jgi:hypothetical protein
MTKRMKRGMKRVLKQKNLLKKREDASLCEFGL